MLLKGPPFHQNRLFLTVVSSHHAFMSKWRLPLVLFDGSLLISGILLMMGFYYSCNCTSQYPGFRVTHKHKLFVIFIQNDVQSVRLLSELKKTWCSGNFTNTWYERSGVCRCWSFNGSHDWVFLIECSCRVFTVASSSCVLCTVEGTSSV